MHLLLFSPYYKNNDRKHLARRGHDGYSRKTLFIWYDVMLQSCHQLSIVLLKILIPVESGVLCLFRP